MRTITRILVILLGLQTLVNCGPKPDPKSLEHLHPSSYYEMLKHKKIQTPNGEPLIVHIVPHTHDDVGWLKTVEEYFNGAKYSTQKAGVELIITSVIEELIKDPAKRFSLVEMKFFSMWWKYQTDEHKDQVR